MKSRRPTQREKTRRAFGAYTELLDAADWIRRELGGPLDAFGLTINEFRLMAMLDREGPMSIVEAAEKRHCLIQYMHVMIARAEKWGWVRKTIVTHPPAKVPEGRLPKAKRGKPRMGPRMGMVSLTPAGKKLIRRVLPRQAKLVKSFMRALDGREQVTLSCLCRKLREGDPIRFFREIRMEDAEEDLVV